MYCTSCGQENTSKSNFCRKCGVGFEHGDVGGRQTPDRAGFKRFFTAQKKIFWLGIVAFIFLFSATAFAAPKVTDYLEVNEIKEEAERLAEEGEFGQAIEVLGSTEGIWTLPSIREEVDELTDRQEQNFDDKNKLERAIGMKQKGDVDSLKIAQALLNDIDSGYPEYEEVQKQRKEIQESIEGRFQKKIEEEEAEAEAARAEAAREREERAHAQREAEAAEAEKRASEAKARAARDEKDAAEASAEEEKVKSFIDETVTIYNSLVQAEASLFAALEDFSNLNYSSYNFSQAYARLDDVKDRSNNMLIYRTPYEDWEGIPLTLYSAADSFDNATYYLAESFIAFGKGLPVWSSYYDQFAIHYRKGRDDMELISVFLEDVGR